MACPALVSPAVAGVFVKWIRRLEKDCNVFCDATGWSRDAEDAEDWEEVCERQKLFKCYQCGSTITVLTFRILQVVVGGRMMDGGWWPLLPCYRVSSVCLFGWLEEWMACSLELKCNRWNLVHVRVRFYYVYSQYRVGSTRWEYFILRRDSFWITYAMLRKYFANNNSILNNLNKLLHFLPVILILRPP